MDVDAFLEEIRSSPDYAGQIAFVRETPARAARFADPMEPLSEPIRRMLSGRGIERLYLHQAEALDRARRGEDFLVVTGTASGKSLCYQIPILESLLTDPGSRALLLYPTKALCQDQHKGFGEALAEAGMGDRMSGVFDGDTPANLRRKLRDHGSAIFSNPDMLHAALMPQHARWSDLLSRLRYVVLDELHAYNGIFGSNIRNLFRRFFRLCRHYGSDPRIIACSATVGNPAELGESVVGRRLELIEEDGAPKGRKVYVFWNPPRIRGTKSRSRRSANAEAHDLMSALILRRAPTIAFSKAKITAELIARYVQERLRETAPQLASEVSPYRGGYLPEERREIERRLFSGELLGVSTTPALELGIDVGGLDACIIVGYPGTRASFFQQSGRAGRKDRDALAILVGLDTPANQYLMRNPDYLFGDPIERIAVDPDNPYVVIGHLRCATHELPLSEEEASAFGPAAPAALSVLEDRQKIRKIGDLWYHAANEVPQHEVSLRSYSDATVTIQDAETGAAIGLLNQFEASPILFPDAIYIHQGDTYRVLSLDMERRIALVKRCETDYYTQPLGGTDIHHIDRKLREKTFGTGIAGWGEVTAYFQNLMYEKVRFYEVDAISRHSVELPMLSLETMGVWIEPPESLLLKVREAGLDAFNGLRAVGYATRMILPLFITCDPLDLSHTVGSANSEWSAVFIYERVPLGLGFTEKAYERLHEVMPAALNALKTCDCEDGCPRCVGKPLRKATVWNVERGEGAIPSKAAALMILEGLLNSDEPLETEDRLLPAESEEAKRLRLERGLLRRMERMREPKLFHPINPAPPSSFPTPEKSEALPATDSALRSARRTAFGKELRKRIAERESLDDLTARADPAIPTAIRQELSASDARIHARLDGLKPKERKPVQKPEVPPEPIPNAEEAKPAAEEAVAPIKAGDSLAARARKMRKARGSGE